MSRGLHLFPEGRVILLLIAMLIAAFRVVQPDGSPVQGAWVGDSSGWFGLTDPHGHFELFEGFSGTLHIHATGYDGWSGPPPGNGGSIVLTPVAVGGGHTITVIAARGALAGRIPSTSSIGESQLVELGSRGMNGLNGMVPGLTAREYGGSMPVVSLSLRGGEPAQADYMIDGISMSSSADGSPPGVIDPAIFSSLEVARGGAVPGGGGKGSSGALNFLPPGNSQPLFLRLSALSSGGGGVVCKLGRTGLSIRRNSGTEGSLGHSGAIVTTGFFGGVRTGFLGSYAAGDTEAPDWTVQGDGFREQARGDIWAAASRGALEGTLSAGAGTMDYRQTYPYAMDDSHTEFSTRASGAWKGPLTLLCGWNSSFLKSTATGTREVHRGDLGAELDRGMIHAMAGWQLSGAGADFSGRLDLSSNDEVGGTAAGASVFTDHRAPTANDLHWPFDGQTRGNPDLESERTTGIEGRVEYTIGGFAGGITGFVTKTENLILWLPGEDGVWSPSNISSALSRGLETHGRFEGGPVDLSGTFTWNLATDQTANTPREGMLLPYRPEYSWGLSAGFRFPSGVSCSMGLNGAGKRFTNRTQTAFLDEYWSADIHGSILLTEAMAVSISADNLLDMDYRITDGYMARGRTFGISLEYRGE